jgi:tetratricopeptide (TPR) repeat protein
VAPRAAPPRAAPPPAPAGGRVARLIVLGLVLGLAAVLAWREETSLDLGFHLATGRQILAERAWPRVDEFTYTVTGRPYIDMHGLFQVGLALAERGRGYLGIGLYRVGLLLAATGLLWASARRRGVHSPLVLAGGFALGLAAWELRFFARPELATYLALALSLYWLRRHAESGDWKWLVGLVPLQFLWVHSHALSVFGIAVLGLYAVASLRHPVRPAWAPWLGLGGAIVAMFLNPYGPAGVEFLWHLRTRLSDENPFAQSISELTSPWNREALGFWPIRAFLALLLTGGIAVLAALRRLALFDLLVFGLFAALAASAVRNIGLFVVAGLPVALAAIQWLVDRPRRRASSRAGRSPGGRAALALAIAIMILFGELVWAGGYYAANRRPERFGYGPSPAVYPLRTVRFLAEHELRGPYFNHLNFGGFLIGERWPRERVFIDGRLEVMGEEFFRKYLEINAGPGWPAMMIRYDPNVALIPITSPQQLNRLAKDPAWQLAEMDGVAALYLRVRPVNASLIADARARFAQLDSAAAPASAAFLPAPLASWPRRTFGRRAFPWEAWGRGNGLYALKRYEAARHEYLNGLAIAGHGELPLALNFAASAFHLGRSEEAAAWYRRVIELDHGNPLAMERLRRLASAGSGRGK